MGLKPENPVVGGTILRRAAIQSPNFITGVSGWSINEDGTAEFDNLTIRGTFNGLDFIINKFGAFFYSTAPATGNLIASITSATGTDSFSNPYLAGISLYSLSTGYVVNLLGSQISFTVQPSSSAPSVRPSITAVPTSAASNLTIVSGQSSASSPGSELDINDAESVSLNLGVANIFSGMTQVSKGSFGIGPNGQIVAYLAPTGDTTGVKDTELINAFLGSNVTGWIILLPGNWYINGGSPTPTALALTSSNILEGCGRGTTIVTLFNPINLGFVSQQNEIVIKKMTLTGSAKATHIFENGNYGRFQVEDCELDVDAAHCWMYSPASVTTGNHIMLRWYRNNCHYRGPRTMPPFYIQTPTGTQVTSPHFIDNDWFNDDNDFAHVIIHIENQSANGSTTAAAYFEHDTVEHAYGGWLYLAGITGCRIINPVMWDLPAMSVQSHLIEFAAGSGNPAINSDITIIGYSRRGGTLASGVNDIYLNGDTVQVMLDTCSSDVGGTPLNVGVAGAIASAQTQIQSANMPPTTVWNIGSGINWFPFTGRGYQNSWSNAAGLPVGEYRNAEPHQLQFTGCMTAPTGVVAGQVITTVPTIYFPLKNIDIPCVRPAGAWLQLTTTGNITVGGGIAATNTVSLQCTIPLDS